MQKDNEKKIAQIASSVGRIFRSETIREREREREMRLAQNK